MRIRRAVPDDLDAVVALERQCFAPQDTFPRSAYQRALAGSNPVFLCEHDGVLLGLVYLLFRKGTRVARIYSIAVLQEARGKGAGRALLAAAADETRARGCDRLRLEVRKSNESAIRLYSLAGFGMLSEKPDYYPDGETALHMEQRLDNEPLRNRGGAA